MPLYVNVKLRTLSLNNLYWLFLKEQFKNKIKHTEAQIGEILVIPSLDWNVLVLIKKCSQSFTLPSTKDRLSKLFCQVSAALPAIALVWMSRNAMGAKNPCNAMHRARCNVQEHGMLCLLFYLKDISILEFDRIQPKTIRKFWLWSFWPSS